MENFLARQPIFDCHESVVAYELLFRSGHATTAYCSPDGDEATASVLSGAFLLLGIDKITNGKPAFINFTRNLLKQNIATCLPSQSVVIEILEDVEPDEEVVAICRELKRLGYIIALDDFVFSHKYQNLIELVDIIKVDFITTSPQQRREIMTIITKTGIKFLAEKVETRADFEQAVTLGYHYFQGYFFSKPETLSEKELPSYSVQYLRVLHEVQQPNLDFNRLEEIIKYDVALFYKLLIYINSSYFGLKHPVSSIKHALILLGQRQIEQWVSLLILRDLGRERPEEVMVLSVVRAKFGELLAYKMKLRSLTSQAFIMGMLSLIDCLLNRPLKSILQELPITTDVKQALLGADTILGKMHTLIMFYEKGDWDKVSYCARECQLPENEIAPLYFQALEWSSNFFQTASAYHLHRQ